MTKNHITQSLIVFSSALVLQLVIFNYLITWILNQVITFSSFTCKSPETEPLYLHVSGTTVNLTHKHQQTTAIDDKSASLGH